jgi:hypothetical protein
MKYGREVIDEFLRTRLEEERVPILEATRAIIDDSSPGDLADRQRRMMNERGKAFLLINEALKYVDT